MKCGMIRCAIPRYVSYEEGCYRVTWYGQTRLTELCNAMQCYDNSTVLLDQFKCIGMSSCATMCYEMQCHARQCYVVTCSARLS
eukprot:3811925-Pyramimonas_sp.AAC.1